MRSILESKPKFTVTPFFKINHFAPVLYTHMTLRLSLKIEIRRVSAFHVFSKFCHAGCSNPVGSIPNPAGHSLSLT